MLLITLAFILVQFLLAVTAPRQFILLSLWTQTIPYTWNFATQAIYDTPAGPLAVVAIQLFGFCLACILVVATNLATAASQAKKFKWHMAFIGFCLFSLVYAPSMTYGLRMVAKLLAPLLFVLVILTAAKSESDLQKMQKAIVGSGIMLVILALYARAVGIDTDPNASETGLVGLGPPSMGPPVFSAHMLAVAMLAVASYVCVPRSTRLVLVAVCAAAVIAALQRTSAAALYLGLAAILFFGTRGIWRVVLPATGILGLPLLIIFSDSFRRRMFLGEESSASLLANPLKAVGSVNGSGRFDLWDSMLGRFFSPHPAIGSGIGSTQEFLAGKASVAAGVVHSEYVRLLCEVGVVGLSLWILTLVSYLWRFRKYTAKSRSISVRTAGLAATGGIVAYAVFCSTDNAFDYVTQFGIYVFALVAIAEKANELSAVAAANDAEPLGSPAPLFPNLMR